MVLYGDSITENWRGTSAGELWKWSNGTLDTRFLGWNMKAVTETAFRNYRTGVMAIAGGLPPLQLKRSSDAAINLHSARLYPSTLSQDILVVPGQCAPYRCIITGDNLHVEAHRSREDLTVMLYHGSSSPRMKVSVCFGQATRLHICGGD